MPRGIYRHKKGISRNKGKHWKIKDTSKMNKEKKETYLGEKNPFWKGGKPKCIDCGKIVSNYGNKRCRKCSGIFRRGRKQPNISKAKLGKPNYKTRKYGNGKMKNYPESERIRKSFEYELWRKAIFQRDNFTCQRYRIFGGELRAHHINNFADFPELRLALDNGITLSKKAHGEFHKIYGKRNNTRGQLEEFLSVI